MNVNQRSIIQTGAGVNLAFALVVLASYFTIFSGITSITIPTALALIWLGVGYIAVGIYGYGYCARTGSFAIQLGYFIVQVCLGGVIIHLGRAGGISAILLLPLAGQSVVMLPRLWMLAVNLVITIAYSAAIYINLGSISGVMAAIPTFIAGQVFIVFFTQMAVQEEQSRGEVERLVSELAVANQRLREYAMQVEELTLARERNRLAREIHDGLGHYLTTVHMQIQAARAILETDIGRAKSALSTAQDLTQEALVDVRKSVASLRVSPQESTPLVDSIAVLIKSCEVIGLEADFTLIGDLRPLSPQAHLTVFRVVQEGLNNTCKHAGASSVWVTLDFSSPQCIKISVKDNGKGAASIEGGFGLVGLKERVHMLNGELDITTTPGEGFSLEATIKG